jgi:penicillin amidase
MKQVGRFLILLLILILGFAGVAVYWTFYKPLPDYNTEVTIDGLSSEVDMYWDDSGIPHIYAQDKADAYMALGYAHAQDRLWQMTLSQLVMEGRMAEYLGPDLVPIDRYHRTLGFWKIAERMDQVLADSTRQLLQAYANGVNRYITTHRNKLPVQFSLTGIQPPKWTVKHSLGLARLMGWELNVSWWTESVFAALQGKLTPEQIKLLIPQYRDDAPITAQQGISAGSRQALAALLDLDQSSRKLTGSQGTHIGSNAWVVDGTHSDTGQPLLAGDPHLGLSMPGKWYQAHINVAGKNVSGATLAGAPMFVLGQNDYLAWSLTSMMTDDTDFFIEQQNPNDRSQYVSDSLSTGEVYYNRFKVDRQIIKVKDHEDVIHEVRSTKHGPIINDIYPADSLFGNQLVSVSWTGQKVSSEIDALLKMNWADSIQEFEDGLSQFKVPGMNFMYADQSGNIAMYSAAYVPLRKPNPVLPRPGWDPDYDWQGYLTDAQLPKVINPNKGWIANANNKLGGSEYPHYISTFWEPPSRIERITERLREKATYSVDDFKELQNDAYSHHAQQVVETILPYLKKEKTRPDYDTIISYLENWDYQYRTSSTAASITDVFFLHFTRNTLMDELGEDTYREFTKVENFPVRVMDRLLRSQTDQALAFFDDVTTDSVEVKSDIIYRSMDETILALQRRFGIEPFQWRWEQMHTITFIPPLFDQAVKQPDAPAPLRVIVNNVLQIGPHPVVGHGMSVNNGQYNWQDPYQMVLGPSIRRIVNLGDLSSTWTILPTGQSGNPLSDYYGDQTEEWLEGSYRTLVQDSSKLDLQQLPLTHFTPTDNE